MYTYYEVMYVNKNDSMGHRSDNDFYLRSGQSSEFHVCIKCSRNRRIPLQDEDERAPIRPIFLGFCILTCRKPTFRGLACYTSCTSVSQPTFCIHSAAVLQILVSPNRSLPWVVRSSSNIVSVFSWFSRDVLVSCSSNFDYTISSIFLGRCPRYEWLDSTILSIDKTETRQWKEEKRHREHRAAERVRGLRSFVD